MRHSLCGSGPIKANPRFAPEVSRPQRESLCRGCLAERASSKCRGGRKWPAGSGGTSSSCQHGVALTPCWQRAVRRGTAWHRATNPPAMGQELSEHSCLQKEEITYGSEIIRSYVSA